MKTDILSLLSGGFMWRFGTWQSSHRDFAVPVLANLQGQLILTWKRAASIASCALSHTSSSQSAFKDLSPGSFLFHRTPQEMILKYEWIPIFTTTRVWWGAHVHWNFFRGFQIKEAEKLLHLAFKICPALLHPVVKVPGKLGAAPCPLPWHWRLLLKHWSLLTLLWIDLGFATPQGEEKA